jgi:RNA polymerase sigma-70 factor (ECF subfamily)
VDYPIRPENCAGRAARAVATDARHSVGVNINVRSSSPTASKRLTRRFAQTQSGVGDWEAIHELFVAGRPRFVGLAFSVLRNNEDAEDAVQDAFVSACRHLRTFEGRSAFTTWFTRIVFNAALMVWRKRKPSWTEAHPEPLSADDTSWMEKIPASQPDPEMVYAERETFQWIDVRLATMSPILRQAFTMSYYDELSNEEAGALLGVTTGTLKSRLLRARRHLMNQAGRSAFAPIRKAVHSQFSLGNNNHQRLAARATELASPEIAFS